NHYVRILGTGIYFAGGPCWHGIPRAIKKPTLPLLLLLGIHSSPKFRNPPIIHNSAVAHFLSLPDRSIGECTSLHGPGLRQARAVRRVVTASGFLGMRCGADGWSE